MLDVASLLATMAYIELNAVAAGVAPTSGMLLFTSIIAGVELPLSELISRTSVPVRGKILLATD